MNHRLLISSACALALTGPTWAQRPGGATPPPAPPSTGTPARPPVPVGPSGPVTPPPSPGAGLVPPPVAPPTNPATGGALPTPPRPTVPVGPGSTGTPTAPTVPTPPASTPATGPTPPAPVPPPSNPAAPGGTTLSPPVSGAAVPADAGTSPIPFPPAVHQQEGVAKALGLTAYQQTELREMSRKLGLRFPNTAPGAKGQSAAGPAAPREQAGREYLQAVLTGAREVMSETQFARYQQLEFQAAGFGALTDPAIQKALNLSEAQRRDLAAELAWAAGQERGIVAADQAEARRLYWAYQKALRERFNRFLSPSQKAAWDGMVGAPFTFTAASSPLVQAARPGGPDTKD
jgi:hypothetical protein